MIELKLTEANINEYGRFDTLKGAAGKEKTLAFFEKRQGAAISVFKVNNLLDGFLRKFLLEGGFDIEDEPAAETGEPRKRLYDYGAQPQPLKVAEYLDADFYKA
jgi:hypothetical protein